MGKEEGLEAVEAPSLCSTPPKFKAVSHSLFGSQNEEALRK